MNIITLVVLLVGIVFLLMGYTDIFYNTKSTEKVYEYRFIPRDVYDNIESNELEDQFSFMFDATDTRNNTNLV
tara:strand:- start:956 stop:1174 length:219 start_codon:yes stop_codon:yes gene_type:complete